jgi:hypothetical protein
MFKFLFVRTPIIFSEIGPPLLQEILFFLSRRRNCCAIIQHYYTQHSLRVQVRAFIKHNGSSRLQYKGRINPILTYIQEHFSLSIAYTYCRFAVKITFLYEIYTETLSVHSCAASYALIYLTGSKRQLVNSTFVVLTDAKFKPLRLYINGFFLSSCKQICI